MRSNNKVEIESVETDSPASKAGLRKGDLLLSVNSYPLHDVIDLMFAKDSDELEIEFFRNGSQYKVVVFPEDEADLGITVKPFRVKTCKNNLIGMDLLSFPY